MSEIIINFEIPAGHFQVTRKITKSGFVRYYVHNTINDEGYVSDNYDYVWSDFVALIDSMDYTK